MGDAVGAGMGRMAEVCGTLTAAVIILGLQYGRTDPEDDETKEHTYELVRVCGDKFRAKVGSIHCRELMGCDISTVDGFKYAREHDLFKTVCPRYIRAAAEILEEMLP